MREAEHDGEWRHGEGGGRSDAEQAGRGEAERCTQGQTSRFDPFDPQNGGQTALLPSSGARMRYIPLEPDHGNDDQLTIG